jgi:Asp-tRNA(Asn)/Glu-tRNA(Gln) amidotransferase C subunit
VSLATGTAADAFVPSDEEQRIRETVATIAALAGVDLTEGELSAFARGLERARALTAELGGIDVENVTPWTPPS